MKTYSDPLSAILAARDGDNVILEGGVDAPPVMMCLAPARGSFVVVVDPRTAAWIKRNAEAWHMSASAGLGASPFPMIRLYEQLPRCLVCGDTGRALRGGARCWAGKRCTCPAGAEA